MFKNRRAFQRVLIIIADMYGFYASLLLIVWLLTGERLFFVNMFVSLMPGIFYFMPFMLVIAILLRSKQSLAFLTIPVVAFAILYAPVFMPRPIEDANGTALSLLTYNLRASNTNTEALDTILETADADIVSLQEVSVEIGEHVENNWIEQYPYQIRFTVADDQPAYAGQLTLLGNAQYAGRLFLSRYPITDYEIVPSSINTTLYVRAELDINGEVLTVYNVHLPPPMAYGVFSTTTRHGGLLELMASVQTDNVILMGDYNMTDQSGDYRLIAGEYTDVFRTVQRGLGTTWANGNNLSPALFFVPSVIRIDYMFVGDTVVPQSARVIRDGVSDHYPLYAEIIFAPVE